MSQPADTTSAAPRPGRGRVRRRLTAEESRQRRRRFFVWSLTIGLGVLLVNALVGETGYLATIRAEREQASLRREYYRLHLENERLKQERQRLETDRHAVEEEGRRMGMIRDGEIMITVRPAGDGTSDRQPN